MQQVYSIVQCFWKLCIHKKENLPQNKALLNPKSSAHCSILGNSTFKQLLAFAVVQSVLQNVSKCGRLEQVLRATAANRHFVDIWTQSIMGMSFIFRAGKYYSVHFRIYIEVSEQVYILTKYAADCFYPSMRLPKIKYVTWWDSTHLL